MMTIVQPNHIRPLKPLAVAKVHRLRWLKYTPVIHNDFSALSKYRYIGSIGGCRSALLTQGLRAYTRPQMPQIRPQMPQIRPQMPQESPNNTPSSPNNTERDSITNNVRPQITRARTTKMPPHCWSSREHGNH